MVFNFQNAKNKIGLQPLHGQKKIESLNESKESFLRIVDPGIVNIFNLRGSQRSSIFRQTIKSIFKIELSNNVGVAIPFSLGVLLQIAPDEWIISSETEEIHSLISTLEKKLTKIHSSIVDVTDQYQVLFISGTKVRTVLSKGCSIDLHPNEFFTNQCTQTLLSSIDIILHCSDKNSFTILCRSSFANFLIDWLKDAGLEYNFSFISN